MDKPDGDAGFVDYQVNTMMLITIGVGMIIFSFVVNDALHSVYHGGIFSAFSAMRAMEDRIAVIDIDGSALRIVLIAICYFITTSIGILFRIVLNRRSIHVFMFAGVIGGVLLDDLLGARLVAMVAGSQGYTRCPARDHVGGLGKGRVRFDDYVLRSSDCPSAQR